MTWRHSGFSTFCGPRIQPSDEKAMENLAWYIIQASFSQERMTYIPEESKVNYQSKNGKQEKHFDALEWLAAMCSHVTNKGEQMVKYYGHFYGMEYKRDVAFCQFKSDLIAISTYCMSFQRPQISVYLPNT